MTPGVALEVSAGGSGSRSGGGVRGAEGGRGRSSGWVFSRSRPPAHAQHTQRARPLSRESQSTGAIRRPTPRAPGQPIGTPGDGQRGNGACSNRSVAAAEAGLPGHSARRTRRQRAARAAGHVGGARAPKPAGGEVLAVHVAGAGVRPLPLRPPRRRGRLLSGRGEEGVRVNPRPDSPFPGLVGGSAGRAGKRAPLRRVSGER